MVKVECGQVEFGDHWTIHDDLAFFKYLNAGHSFSEIAKALVRN